MSWGGLGASWGFLGCLGGVLGRLVTVLGASWGRLGSKKVANMAPTWFPKRSQIREKIDAKSDQNFDASWVRFLEDFGGFGEAKWRQVGTKIASKIDPNFARRFFEKNFIFLKRSHDFEGSGGRSWE